MPVELSLTPLFRTVEQSVPRQAGNWQHWQKRHGVQTKYQAWRGPLGFRMQGENLLVQAHVRYWIKARAKLLNAIGIDADCGVDEPPRQAVISVLVRFGWTPDWGIRPQFQILPTRFLDRCEMTVADIDVTPLIGKVFRKQMQESLSAAMRMLSPRLQTLRGQAETAWSVLQKPVELGGDNWLLLRPAGIALSPLYGQDAKAGAHLALMMYPIFTSGEKPRTERTPLPPLWMYYPRSEGLDFSVAVELDFADLGSQIIETSGKQSIEIKGHTFTVKDLRVSGKEQEIRVKVELGGDGAGQAEVWANVFFAPESQQLRLKDLHYRYEPEDPALEFLSEAFYQRIRQQLLDQVNQLLEEQLDQWNQSVKVRLEKSAPAGMQLDFSSLRLRSVDIRMLQDSIRLEGKATGKAKLRAR